jgi:hypothetical protein
MTDVGKGEERVNLVMRVRGIDASQFYMYTVVSSKPSTP